MEAIDVQEPFTARDLKRLGISRHRLRTMLRRRVVRRIVRGVYGLAAWDDDLQLRVRAIALVVSAGHVICDRTAAWLHDIDIFPRGDHDLGLPVEACVPAGSEPSECLGADGHQRDLRPDEIADMGGVLVTTPLRTALDLGCVLERRDALAALDAFRRRHGISRTLLEEKLHRRFRGRRGVIQCRELVALSDDRSESIRESWVRITIIDAGLPPPDLQVWVEIDGVPTYRVDLAYRRLRIAVEYDGHDAHDVTEEQREHDRVRRARLRALGWTVIVVRNGDFTSPRLELWLAELRAALEGRYSNRRRLERGPVEA